LLVVVAARELELKDLRVEVLRMRCVQLLVLVGVVVAKDLLYMVVANQDGNLCYEPRLSKHIATRYW